MYLRTNLDFKLHILKLNSCSSKNLVFHPDYGWNLFPRMVKLHLYLSYMDAWVIEGHLPIGSKNIIVNSTVWPTGLSHRPSHLTNICMILDNKLSLTNRKIAQKYHF